MTSRQKGSGRQLRQLNPAFAAAHGIDRSSQDEVLVEKSSKTRLDIAIKQARATGKLNVSNAGLSCPLPDILFDLRHGMQVNLSMDASEASSFEVHAEETLTLVDFSDNDIGAVLDNRIQRYQSLSIFRLKRCNLTALPQSEIQSLKNLTILDLASNRLESLPIDMLPLSIRELDLSSNKLASLMASGSNVVLPNLVKLNVSHNALQSIPEGLVCPELQSLDCGHNCLSELPSCFLEGTCPTLTSLEARHNRMSISLDISKFSQLRMVDLSENQLTEPPTVHTSLVRLALSENKITSLDSLYGDSNEHSSNPSQLVELHLCGNGLKELNEGVMRRLLNIKLLDVRNNNLSNLPPVLGYLPNVRQMILHGNPLRTMTSVNLGDARAVQALLRKRGPRPPGNGFLPQETDDTFVSANAQAPPMSTSSRIITPSSDGANMLSSALVGTKILNLEGRDLKAIPPALMQQLQGPSTVAQRIEVLKLGKNKLEYMNGDLVTLLPNLKTLEMDQNCLTELPHELRNLSLSILSLSRNRLTSDSLASSLVENMPMTKTLTHLNLSCNGLEWLPSGLMEFESLQVLNLSNNRITSLAMDPSIPSGWKIGLPALQHLDVSSNRIDNLGDLPCVLGASCPRLKVLLLHNNQLKTIPPQLGMLESLQTIDLRGNPQRALRYAVLEKGCDSILLYLRNRLTRDEIEAYNTKRRAMGVAIEAPPIEQQFLSEDAARTNDTVQSNDAEAVPTRDPTANKDTTSPFADELCVEIDSLSLQLKSVQLSEAQKYATKKKLALAKSKLIREQRRLQESSST